LELADLRALEAVLKTLEPLTPEERERVLRWAVEKLQVKNLSVVDGTLKAKERDRPTHVDRVFEKHGGFDTIGEFVAAAAPKTDVDRVLTAAVYLQDFADDPQKTLTGREINDQLKHLGFGVRNITDCINTLKARSPQHMIQTKKNGGARQAWKDYRVTRAGIDHVYKLISNGDHDAEA